jgi:transposase InsO family protein
LNTLADLFIFCGLPNYIRSDNRPEFISETVRDWIPAVGAKAAYITPGSSWENGVFNITQNARIHHWGTKH